ncbi:MAG: universal stress protein [Inquilinus sp.]|nr:universal stress protein [Inquilinus sp.]
MTKRVLASVDGSDAAAKALDFAIDYAGHYDGVLHLLYVAPDGAPPKALMQFAEAEHIPDKPSAVYRAIGDSILDNAASRAREAGVETLTTKLDFGDAAERIIDYAGKHGIDVIVLGTRGLGELKGLLLGSVSMKVQSLAPCTCVCVR